MPEVSISGWQRVLRRQMRNDAIGVVVEAYS